MARKKVDEEMILIPDKVLIEFCNDLIDVKYIKQITMEEEWDEKTDETSFLLVFNKDTMDESTLNNKKYYFQSEESRDYHLDNLRGKLTQLEAYGYFVLIV